MALALRGSAVVPTGNPTTGFNVTIPSQVLEGDLLFLTLTSRDSTGAGTLSVTDNDSGGNTWTKIANSTDHKATLWYKRATSATASKSVTVANAVGSTSGVLKCFSGGDGGATPYTNIVVEPNASGDETHAGFTPANADSMVCAAVFNYANDNAVTSLSFATLGATTATEKTSTGGSDCGCIFGHVLQAGAAAGTGNLTWAQTDGTTYSITWAIKPAAALSLALAQGTFTLTGQAVATRWNRRLAANQGSFVLTGNPVTLPGKITDNLVAHWKFNEASGTTRNDSWGTNNATNSGTAVGTTTGIVGNAATFREDGYLTVLDSIANSVTGNFTACIGVKLIAGGANDFPALMGKWDSTGGRSWFLGYRRDTNRFTFSVSVDGTGATGASITHTFVPSNNTQYWVWGRKTGTLIELRISTTSSIGSWENATSSGATLFDSTASLDFGRLGTSSQVGNFDLDVGYLWNASIGDGVLAQVWNNGAGFELASPIASAGQDQVRKGGELAMLDSSRSTDDIAITERLWEQISGTSVTLSDTGAINPTYTCPAAPATLVFKVTVENALAQTDSDQVTISVVDPNSTTWLWHTPQEANIDPAGFHDAIDSMPSPCFVARNGRVIGTKGDVTFEGLTWSASKMLTALIAARQIHLNNIEYSDTIPNSDFPSAPTATLLQFLNMTSDYGLNSPSHSPGDHFAYNNGSVHHYGTYLRDAFYTSQTRLQAYQNAYMSALNMEDTVTYDETTWAGDNKMSGWNGGVGMSTRDLARVAQLVLQGGVWDGTQILDSDFCTNQLWQEQIPDAATQSTDEDDEFYNQAETSAVMKDDWSLGFWFIHPGGIQTQPFTAIAMFGKYGTSAWIHKGKGIIACACNVGGQTDDSVQTRILSSSLNALLNASANAYVLPLSSGSFTETGQSVSLLKASKVALAQGSYALTGSDAALSLTRGMIADVGTFTETGQAVSLFRAVSLSIQSGSFSLTGNTANLVHGRSLSLASGSFSETGNATALRVGRLTSLASGSFAVTGNGSSLLFNHAVTLASGAFTLTGFDVGLSKQGVGGFTISIATGSFALSGQTTNLLRGLREQITTGSFTETGQSVSLLRSQVLTLNTGSFSVTGNAVTVQALRQMLLATGTFSQTGFDVGLIVFTPPTEGVAFWVDLKSISIAAANLASISTLLEQAGIGSIVTFNQGTISVITEVSGAGEVKAEDEQEISVLYEDSDSV